MKQLESKYDISPKEMARGRRLKIGAFAAPVILAGIPAILFSFLFFLFGSTPPTAFTFFILGLIFTAIGLLTGLIISGVLAYRHSNWTAETRELIAADGIRAEEIDWFTNELKSNEKRALKAITASDLLLADAYRETLASRLTASRIIRSSKRELSSTRQRQLKLKSHNSKRSEEFRQQIDRDAEKIEGIHQEAKQMLVEAEARLQMIEAATLRGSSLADSELALKKLSARSAQLPLALEEAKMAEEIRLELEGEPTEK